MVLTRSSVLGLCSLLCIAGVLFLTDADQIIVRTAFICGFAIVFFATRLLPEILTAILCFLAFIAVGSAPPEVIFSGFMSSAFWLIFSGLIIGAAITQTGLGKQIATRIFAKTGNSYHRAVVLLALSGLGLGFLVPSTMPRIIVLMPVAASLATTMGFANGSRGQIGLAITAATATLLPTYGIMTANLPTIIHYGALETLYGIKPSYGLYLIAQAPVNLVRFGILVLLLVSFAKPEPSKDTQDSSGTGTPMTGTQLRLLVLLGIAITFWATDSLHGISPAWIALSLAAIVLWPPAGFLAKDSMKTSIDMSPAFFLVAIFGVSAVARHLGLDTRVAEVFIPHLGLADGSVLRKLYSVTGFSVFISHLTTAPAAPVVLAPLAGSMAEVSGLPVFTVAMAQVIGIATPLIPYQAPPLIVAMSLAHISVPALTRICIGLAVGVAVVGLPLTYLWWHLIGLI